MKKQVRVRLAPSPTGFIHVGTIYTALFNFVFAKKNKGKFILRIEDTDRERYVKGAEEAIYEGLNWVNLIPDESPQTPREYGPYRQSERLKLYQQYAEELVKRRDAYYCFCSVERLEKMRKEQQEKNLPPKYDGRCLNLPEEKIREKLKLGEPKVIRLKIPSDRKIVFTDLIRGKVEFASNEIDDQILLKSDSFPTYHLAVVVDDHLMEITHVIRAEEWLSSVPKHLLIYEAFGWEKPEYAHLPLIRNPDRSKLSKRRGHATLSWYQKEGFLPEALLNFLALLGWSHPEGKEIFSLAEMIQRFSFERFSKTGPIFDLGKLEWMNGVYIRQLSIAELTDKVEQYLKIFNPSSRVLQEKRTYREKVVALEQERLKKLSDFEELSGFFFAEEIPLKKEKLFPETKDKKRAVYVLIQTKKLLEEAVKKWEAAILEESLNKFLEELPDWTKKELFMMVRYALSGKTATPPLFETLAVLGRERTLQRLNKALEYAQEKL